MNDTIPKPQRQAIVLLPGEGREYPMGRMSAVFKADADETDNRVCIYEWWVEPYTQGPPEHWHDDTDDIVYVIEGTLSYIVGDKRVEAPRGSFIMIPGGMKHGFDNLGPTRAGVLAISVPGGFEKHMYKVVDYFASFPVGDAGVKPSEP